MLAVAFEADAAQRNHLVIAFDLVEGLLNDDRLSISQLRCIRRLFTR
jgi:hypothetical protein